MKTVDKLTASLKSISDDLSSLIETVSVKKMQRHPSIAIMAPDYCWRELSPEQKNKQIQLKRDYDQILEVLSMLLSAAPKDICRELAQADKDFRSWLEFESSWSFTPDPAKNTVMFEKDAKSVFKIIEILSSGASQDRIIIPDTNSIMINPDPTDYRSVVGSEGFRFLLLPTVLGELDEIKILHRNPDARERAKKCITRIKGWRAQGSLQSGVTVDSTIVVSAGHKEPDMVNTLSWLDSETKDDRIIANILSVQVEYLNAGITLITGDINLQNKADAAYIDVAEI